MDVVYRVFGVVGIVGGSMALLAFAGVLKGDEGDPGLLVLGIVMLAIGVPSLIRWIKTL